MAISNIFIVRKNNRELLSYSNNFLIKKLLRMKYRVFFMAQDYEIVITYATHKSVIITYNTEKYTKVHKI